jgi:hypothetical protein
MMKTSKVKHANLAPILLFVYNRPLHTKETVNALKKNYLSEKSDIFIFSDGSKNELDFDAVTKVRQYIKTISHFKSVSIITRNKNLGLAKSIITGVTEIINIYGRVIVVEDDMVTEFSFLEYMNNALSFYKYNSTIGSISGYKYPGSLPKIYKNDVFVFYRFCSWGWGTWKDEWNSVDFKLEPENSIFFNSDQKKRINRGGNDLFKMLKLQLRGEINSWAIMVNLSFSKYDKLTLYPSFDTLVHNSGLDGSGVHCSNRNIKKINSNNENVIRPFIGGNVHIDNEIINIMRKELDLTYLQQFTHVVRSILGRKLYFLLKRILIVK